jgi:hypothetical protein
MHGQPAADQPSEVGVVAAGSKIDRLVFSKGGCSGNEKVARTSVRIIYSNAGFRITVCDRDRIRQKSDQPDEFWGETGGGKVCCAQAFP